MARKPIAGAKPSITPEQREMLRASWQYRVLIAAEHAEGENPQDPLFRILTAAIALPTDRPPWCGPSAIITESGLVVCNFVDAAGKQHGPTAMCHLDDLVSNLRRLCDEIHFGQREVDAVFAALRRWITHDNRPEAVAQKEARLPGVDL